MFRTTNDSSKVALVALVEFAQQVGIKLIDCQMTTPHLLSLGAREITRQVFLKKLKKHLENPTIKGIWDSGHKSMKVNIIQN